MNLLLLCDYQHRGAQTVLDHIDAIVNYTGHRVFPLSILGDLPENLDLGRFDGVVIHYSLIISNDSYLSEDARRRIRDFPGVKAVFVQDEYRWVNRTIEALRFIRSDLLFTCVPAGEVEKVYPTTELPRLKKITVLTGYVPDSLLGMERRDYGDRPIDVGYRGRKLSAFYGQLAREKWLIAERFARDAPAYRLRCDISCRESRRLYGKKWIDFISSCKAVLGAESGASVFDFTGEIQPAVEEYERLHPRATFEEVRDRFFPGLDGLIRLNQISPRCFEAAALGTMMVLYEGEYSGVLVPERHYIPLKKDHSNMADVVAAIRSEATWRRITRAAYEEVACNEAWSYRRFGRLVGEALSAAAVGKPLAAAARGRPYEVEEFVAITRAHQAEVERRNAERAKYNAWHWRAVALFVRYGPAWLVRPMRWVWHVRKRRAA